MLNSVVHAVTMEICVALSSSSVEGMVVSNIKMSMSIQHDTGIGNIVLYSYTLILRR